MLDVLEPLFIMSRAHEESHIKSVRTAHHWKTRQTAAREHSRPHGGRFPAWLDLTSSGYRLKPGPANTIKTIFDLASTHDFGVFRIVRWLNANAHKHPPFNRTKAWNDTYVRKILQTRAVLGEYQPTSAGLPLPPVPGYFPPIVTEHQWSLAQAATASRKNARGRTTDRESNLFTGIIREAEPNSASP